MTHPRWCPFCRAVATLQALHAAIPPRIAKLGFEVAEALGAEVDTAEIWRCCSCGSQYNNKTKVRV